MMREPMRRLKIIYIGTGKRGVVCLNKLFENNKDVKLVVVHPEKFDKHATQWQETVQSVAESQNLPIFAPMNINSNESLIVLKKYKPDLIVIAGYGQILKKKVIELPTHGVLNLHGGLLPQYRGSSPLNWALINGETSGGCSVILINEGIDTGDIVAQEKFDITLQDTILNLQEKTFNIFPRLLLQAINSIEQNKIITIPQVETQAFYYHKRKPEDGKIDWKSMKAMQVYNLIRALTHPYPGAYTFMKSGQRQSHNSVDCFQNRV